MKQFNIQVYHLNGRNGIMSPLDFCKLFPGWIESLPQKGLTPVMVRRQRLPAKDLQTAPYFGELFQAFCEGRLGALMLEWTA